MRGSQGKSQKNSNSPWVYLTWETPQRSDRCKVLWGTYFSWHEVELPHWQNYIKSQSHTWFCQAQLTDEVTLTKRKGFRGGPRILKRVGGGAPTSAEGASFLGGSGDMLPRKFLKSWDKFRTRLILIFASKLRFCKKKIQRGPPVPPPPFGFTTGLTSVNLVRPQQQLGFKKWSREQW